MVTGDSPRVVEDFEWSLKLADHSSGIPGNHRRLWDVLGHDSARCNDTIIADSDIGQYDRMNADKDVVPDDDLPGSRGGWVDKTQ